MKRSSHTKAEVKLDQARSLLSRLERIPVDSPWSHRASGIRASLAKTISKLSTHPRSHSLQDLDKLFTQGYRILENAARDLKGDRTFPP